MLWSRSVKLGFLCGNVKIDNSIVIRHKPFSNWTCWMLRHFKRQGLLENVKLFMFQWFDCFHNYFPHLLWRRNGSEANGINGAILGEIRRELAKIGKVSRVLDTAMSLFILNAKHSDGVLSKCLQPKPQKLKWAKLSKLSCAVTISQFVLCVTKCSELKSS